MKPELMLDLRTFGFVVSTRAALGVGIGLLIADRLPPQRRRALGVGLLAAGVLTTIPAGALIAGAMRRARRQRLGEPEPVARVEQDDRLRGLSRFARRGDDELAG